MPRDHGLHAHVFHDAQSAPSEADRWITMRDRGRMTSLAGAAGAAGNERQN